MNTQVKALKETILVKETIIAYLEKQIVDKDWKIVMLNEMLEDKTFRNNEAIIFITNTISIGCNKIYKKYYNYYLSQSIEKISSNAFRENLRQHCEYKGYDLKFENRVIVNAEKKKKEMCFIIEDNRSKIRKLADNL